MVKLGMCQCDIDAPTLGHCMRKKYFTYVRDVHTGRDHQTMSDQSSSYIFADRSTMVLLLWIHFVCLCFMFVFLLCQILKWFESKS